MFNRRSYRKELLDAEVIPVGDLHRNLRELDFINTLLGGHAVTVSGLRQVLEDKSKTYHILDIGSGGGDTLRYIAKWGRKHGYHLQLTGVDLKQDCIDFAAEACKAFPEISFIQSDYKDLNRMQHEFDVVITSLFCHHLTDEELEGLFAWCTSRARIAFVMNDLHRHPVAYYSIAWLTALFSGSYLVKNDAKLSVLRGFKRKELMQLVTGLPMHAIRLQWRWAFRWLLIIRTTA